MSDQRDLLEAQSYERRRVREALETGSTRGPRPVATARLQVWGLALAVLACLAAAALRVLGL